MPIHPSKHDAIKTEIDKLKQSGFIYPIEYTTWVSDHVPILKKQGTIHVYTKFHDLNLACPKENFPTPFIDQIIDECVEHEIISFMDGFLRYNQIHILHVDQQKNSFTSLWETFAYKVMPIGLKNVGATFQRVMSYYFHDFAHIILKYIDDLTTCSKLQS